MMGRGRESPWIVLVVAGAIGASFVAGVLGGGPWLRTHAALHAPGSDGLFRPWQLLTSAGVHGLPLHLALNVVGLLAFGPRLERALGPVWFAGVLVGSAVAAALSHLADPQAAPVLYGASGVVLGVIGAYAVLFGRERVHLFWAFPVPLWLIFWGLIAAEAVGLVLGVADGVSQAAHVGGAVAGAGLGFLRRHAVPVGPSG